MGTGTDGFGFGTSSWNQNREDVYGYWVLEGHFASAKYALVIWPDIGPNANMYETTKDLLKTTDTNIRSQFPYSLSTTTNVGNGAYGSNLNDRGPNDSGAARTNFFDVIKDFNRQLSPGVNENGSRIQNKRYPIHYAQYGGLGSSFVASTDTKEVSFESNDKKLTWATTKDLLDVKDKNGPLRLGIGRYTLYYTGNLLHFSYFNKLVSQDDLSKIHTYYSLFYKNTWGLRISLNEDVSLTNTKSITDLSNTVYKLSNLSGHEINSFWSYDANKIGSVSLSNFVLIGTNGTINFGDGSIPKEYFNNRILSHGFAASNSLQGSYNNRKGFLSDNNKLQDSNFWQNYSYQIKTNLSSSEWINQYLRLVHPAGMKLFAAFLLQIVRKNNWTGDKDYSADNAQEKNQLEVWLKKLIPPWRRDDVDEFGYHMPFYQPGWLSSDARLLSLLLEGLVFAGQNARSGGNLFVRTVLMVLKFISGENRFNRNDIVFRQHLKDQKFFDSHTRSADYAYLTGNELGIQRRGVIPSQSSEPNFLSTFLPWSVGSGHDNVYGTTSSLRWEAAGSTAENVREYRKDPFGKSSIVWVAKDLDTTGEVDYDGGFYSPMVNIDASLNVIYRFSVWMKQQNRTGDKYFGLFARDTGGDETTDTGIQRADDNAASQFPHFLREFDLPRNNEWFLLVGYLRPLDSTGETPNQTILTDTSGGVYDTSGNRVLREDFRTFYSPVEWKYTSDVNGLRLRAFVTNNTSNTGSEVEIWGPRIEIVGPVSPDIPELIFPTIDSNIMYGNQNRPLDKFVYKLNNFSTKIEGEAQPFIVNSVTTNDINYYNQVNYNENLKFLDNTKIGSYYSVKISDMANTQESGLVVQSDDGYITPAAGDNPSQNEYSSYTISNPPSSAY